MKLKQTGPTITLLIQQQNNMYNYNMYSAFGIHIGLKFPHRNGAHRARSTQPGSICNSLNRISMHGSVDRLGVPDQAN